MSRDDGLSLAVVVVLAAVAVIAVWPDPRLSAGETAAQLRARVGAEWTFTCSPEENDGTISGMDDVDYFCQPADAAHVEETGYWVGTDGSRIVAFQPAG
jgi:hypothetical protein